HVVQQLDFIPQFLAQMIKQLRHRPAVSPRLPDVRLIVGLRLLVRTRAVRALSGHRYLRADITLAGGDQFLARFRDFFERVTAGVAIRIDRLAALAPEELVDRHACALAEDIPQGHVDAADGVAEHRPVAPVRAEEAGTLNVLDGGRVLADEEGLEEAVDG